MNSFSLIRTNPKLTTNIKLVVSSNYELFLESFNSTPDLESDRFKKFRFNKDNFYDELVPFFFKKVPASTAFSVKYSDDNDKMYSNFDKQYDDIYMAGCNNVEDTDYKEEFECLSPLYINTNNIPTNFIIFRADGPGIIDLDKNNFNVEILDKLKCIKSFDLSNKTPIGEFLDRNYRKNDSFPTQPFELDFRKSEFSKWSGIEYESGGYCEKSLFIEDWLEKEKTFFEFEKFITDGYEDNKVIYPNILNLKFLFDDTPGDKIKLNKWSINRYLGFYTNSMDVVKSVSLYSPYKLEVNLVIATDNICKDLNNKDIKPIVKDWDDKKVYYIEYSGKFYRIERFTAGNSSQYVYKIISDLDLSGKQSLFNKNIIDIDQNNIITHNTLFNTSNFIINGFDKADMWLIDIGGKLHRLKKDNNGSYLIYTDYGFRINNNILEYFINESDSSYTTTIDLNNISDIDIPQTVNIYRVNFTDIKDFDTSIINTEWSSFEYELPDIISDSDEPKLYKINTSDYSEPKQFDEFIYNNNLYNIPTTSEYIASSEIFETMEKDTVLSDIWRKNSVFCKWGYQGSIANNDYVYKANNSLLGDDFNRVTNTFDITPSREERNLDYFYTINSDSNLYLSHSLHITGYTDVNLNQIDVNFSFEINKYLNIGTVSVGASSSATYSGDYFNYFFNKKESFKNTDIIKNSKKYSVFNSGDNVVTNSTLFRGIKFNIYKVSNLLFKEDSQIDKISVEPTSDFDDYKLSVLFTSNNEKVTNNGIITINNSLVWRVLEQWELGKQYLANDYVVYSDIIWKSNANTLINDGNINPSNSPAWSTLSTIESNSIGGDILWHPTLSQFVNNWIYRYGEYYYYNVGVAPAISSFWLPSTNYIIGDKIIYKNVVYEAIINNVSEQPLSNNSKLNKNWKININSYTNRSWYIVEQWDTNNVYVVNDYAIYDNSLYQRNILSLDNGNPSISNDWSIIHSIEPDTNKVYNINKTDNNLIRINGEYYWCISNIGNDTLDNGIDIYINKKCKNIIINIYNNDNTLSKISNVNRDELYSSLYTNLTAKNFMDAINDLDNKYGFSDYIRYIVIDVDGSHNVYSYNDNLTQLPYIIETQSPDLVEVRTKSFSLNGVSPNKNLFKIKMPLKNSEINNITELNYYNGDDLGVELIANNDDINIIDNQSGQRNINYIPIYRHSGDYTPIFQEIELFKATGLNNDDLVGNYKFDTSLTKFGIMSERIFSKVNINGDILKFKDLDNYNSIYPMIDEFGYSYTEHFIFKSTWDEKYYISIEK